MKYNHACTYIFKDNIICSSIIIVSSIIIHLTVLYLSVINVCSLCMHAAWNGKLENH